VSGIRLEDVAVAFDDARVLDGIDLSIPGGAWVGLIGPNGAGKTTLLRAVAGLIPSDGRIHAADMDVTSTSRRTLARLVAYVPQRPLVPATMPVGDYVLLGRTPHLSYLGTEGPRDLEVASALLERLELVSFTDRMLGSLSGGELQRAVLARSLAQEASILLLDEPTSALDVGHQLDALELVDELRRERGLTILSAMHDLTLAGQFAEQLALLSGGRLVAGGSAGEVLTEETILQHYGARVRVVRERDGRVAVIPTRSAAG
jgi:iron complex transport system ATP-binding protein